NAMRNGDFSEWPQPIYDPNTTRLNPTFNANSPISASNPKYLRDQISCNGRLNVICPDRFSPAALGFLKYLPAPNKSGLTENYLHTFSPTILNHAAFGYLNRNEGYGSVNYTYADQLPQIGGVPSHAYPPAVSFGNGYTSMGNSTGSNLDGITTRPTYVFNDM